MDTKDTKIFYLQVCHSGSKRQLLSASIFNNDGPGPNTLTPALHVIDKTYECFLHKYISNMCAPNSQCICILSLLVCDNIMPMTGLYKFTTGPPCSVGHRTNFTLIDDNYCYWTISTESSSNIQSQVKVTT